MAAFWRILMKYILHRLRIANQDNNHLTPVYLIKSKLIIYKTVIDTIKEQPLYTDSIQPNWTKIIDKHIQLLYN